MISQSGLKKFKKLYAKRFGKELCDSDTLRKAQSLLNIWKTIYGNPLEVKVEGGVRKNLQANKQNKHEETKKEKTATHG